MKRLLNSFAIVLGSALAATQANAQAFFAQCIRSGFDARIRDAVPLVLHKAEVVNRSVVSLEFITTADNEPFLDKNSRTRAMNGSGVFVACDVILTSAHNVVINPDPQNRFVVRDSYDVDADRAAGRLKVSPVQKFVVHPTFQKNFEEKRVRSLDEAWELFGSDEMAQNDFALTKVNPNQFQNYTPMKIAESSKVDELSRRSGVNVSVSGFGAEAMDQKFLGRLKSSDMETDGSGFQPANATESVLFI